MIWVYTCIALDRDAAVASLRSYRPDVVVVHVYPVHWSVWVEGQPLADYLRALVCPARRWWRVVCREPGPITLVPA